LVIALVFSGCASSSKDKDKSSVGSLSSGEQKELELGYSIHQEILSTYYLYTEPNLNHYVNSVAEKIYSQAKRKFPYQVTVLVSEKIYAVSAPGGYIYITTGFINFLQNESELAAAIAHEVGQLQYQEPRFSNKKKAMEALEIAAALAAGILGPLGALAFLGVRGISMLTVSEKTKTGRAIYADKLALSYLVEAGYDPQSLFDILTRLAETDKGDMDEIFDYYNSRPISVKRVQKLEKQFKKLNLKNRELCVNRPEFLEATKGVREMFRMSSAKP